MKRGAFDQLRSRRRVVQYVRGQPADSWRVTVGFIRRNSMMQPCHAGALLQVRPNKSIENFAPTLFLPARQSRRSKRKDPPGKLCLHGMTREAKKFLVFPARMESPPASQRQFQADSNSRTAGTRIRATSSHGRWLPLRGIGRTFASLLKMGCSLKPGYF